MTLGVDTLNLRTTKVLGMVAGFTGKQKQTYGTQYGGIDESGCWLNIELQLDDRKQWLLLKCSWSGREDLEKRIKKFAMRGGEAIIDIADYGEVMAGPTTEPFAVAYCPQPRSGSDKLGKKNISKQQGAAL